MSPDSTRWAPQSKADKALLLWTLIGMEETDLDVLLHMCHDPPVAGPECRDRAGPPDALDVQAAPSWITGEAPQATRSISLAPLRAPQTIDLLEEVVAAYPDCTVTALMAHPFIRLPSGVRRGDLPHMTLTARVALRARRALLALVARCEAAGISVIQALDRLALCIAPQLHATLAVDDTHEPAFRSLLAYQQRRCDARGLVLSVRAAQQTTVRRTVAKVSP